MLEVKVEITDQITGDIKRIKSELAQVPKQGLVEFRRLTPIDTGRARRSTTLQGDTIRADYPYAQRLDEGWSKQAPRGIVGPWQQWFEKKIKQIMGR